MTDSELRYLTRFTFDPLGSTAAVPVSPAAPGDAAFSLSLTTLEEAPTTSRAPGLDWSASRSVRFDAFAVRATAERHARELGGEAYERVLAVHGRWSAWSGYAVAALWEVADPEREEAFRHGRRLLFEARREHLRTFAFDWLLRQIRERGEPARYLVLGLYGDEADLRQARSHPEIQRVAAAHAASAAGATDLTGVRYFRVAEVAGRAT